MVILGTVLTCLGVGLLVDGLAGTLMKDGCGRRRDSLLGFVGGIVGTKVLPMINVDVEAGMLTMLMVAFGATATAPVGQRIQTRCPQTLVGLTSVLAGRDKGLSLFERAERTTGYNSSGWLLDRIVKDNGRGSTGVAPAQATEVPRLVPSCGRRVWRTV